MKHVSERTEGDYDVLEAAKELAGYTLRVTSNENCFPKRYRLSVVNKMQEKAFEILDLLMMAYEIYPNSEIEFEHRIFYQKKARAGCRSLLLMIEVAANTFNIKASTFEHFTRTTVDLRNHITAWIKSDVKRFKWGADYK